MKSLNVPIRLCSNCKYGRPAVVEIVVEIDGKKIVKRKILKDYVRCFAFRKIGKLGSGSAIVPVEFAEICPCYYPNSE